MTSAFFVFYTYYIKTTGDYDFDTDVSLFSQRLT